MFQLKTSHKTLISFLVIYFMMFIFGYRQSYMTNEQTEHLRYTLGAPIVFLFLIYLCFVFIHNNGKTGYDHIRVKNNNKANITLICKTIPGLILFSWGIPLTTLGLASSLAYFYPGRQVEMTLNIASISEHGGPRWSNYHSIHAIDPISNKQYFLHVYSRLHNYTSLQRSILITGRAGPFGVNITSLIPLD